MVREMSQTSIRTLPRSTGDQRVAKTGVVRWCCVGLASFLLGSAGMAVSSPSMAAEAPWCRGADVDIEMCVVPGVRDGTFLLQDRDGTIVASVPSDPSRCPDQTFEVTLTYPITKPNLSLPREQRTTPMLSVLASASGCAQAVPSRVLRLERSEVHYGLGPKDLAERMYAPSTVSIGSIARLNPNAAFDVGLSFIRPTVRVDSLTRLVGTAATVTGIPCGKAKRRPTCKAKYARAIETATPYGRSSCGRCPVPSGTLALVYTYRDDVRVVTDLQAFLGPIDSAADAVLWREGKVVAALDGGSWLVMRNEIDGTCDPLERAEVYERVRSDGRVEAVARLLVSRQFNVCA